MLTTSQLCARITDVSKATLYRHIDLLASEGVLEVAEERRVRGRWSADTAYARTWR
ncbi:hypothetical protein ACFQ0B_74170 [Nonomuraea thailandensis]